MLNIFGLKQKKEANDEERINNPLVAEGAGSGVLGIRDIRMRFTNGMDLSQSVACSASGLYSQSSGYVYSLLKDELSEHASS